VVGWAGLPGFALVIEDEPEKSSVVCPSSQTKGMDGNGAIRTVNRAVNTVFKAQVELLIAI